MSATDSHLLEDGEHEAAGAFHWFRGDGKSSNGCAAAVQLPKITKKADGKTA